MKRNWDIYHISRAPFETLEVIVRRYIKKAPFHFWKNSKIPCFCSKNDVLRLKRRLFRNAHIWGSRGTKFEFIESLAFCQYFLSIIATIRSFSWWKRALPSSHQKMTILVKKQEIFENFIFFGKIKQKLNFSTNFISS